MSEILKVARDIVNGPLSRENYRKATGVTDPDLYMDYAENHFVKDGLITTALGLSTFVLTITDHIGFPVLFLGLAGLKKGIDWGFNAFYNQLLVPRAKRRI